MVSQCRLKTNPRRSNGMRWDVMIGRVLAAPPHVLTPVESYLASIHSELFLRADPSAIHGSGLPGQWQPVLGSFSSCRSTSTSTSNPNQTSLPRGMVRISFVAADGVLLTTNKWNANFQLQRGKTENRKQRGELQGK